MHHARTTPKPRCSCRSGDEGAASTALAMFIFAAVLPPSHGAPLAAPAAGAAAAASDRLFDHAFVPDPPPPRRSLC